MEYTKDLILNVHYDEVKNTISFKRRTSSLIDKIKKHKIISATIVVATAFILIDSVLILNFMNILQSI